MSEPAIPADVNAGALEIVRNIVSIQFNSIVDDAYKGESRLKTMLPSGLNLAERHPQARKCLLHVLDEEKRKRLRQMEAGTVDTLKRRRDMFDKECESINATKFTPATKNKKLRHAENLYDAYAVDLQADIDTARALLARATPLVHD